MAYENIYDYESKYEVYLNGQLQSDVADADDELGIVILFEHDRQGRRVPWYNEETRCEDCSTIRCRGQVKIVPKWINKPIEMTPGSAIINEFIQALNNTVRRCKAGSPNP